MEIQSLIDGCRRLDKNAWDNLWNLLDIAAAPPVRAATARWRVDASFVDDIMQELWIYLAEDDFRRLSVFRGRTRPEFEAYLRTVGRRFASRFLRSACAGAKAGRARADDETAPDECGPTETEILFELDEIESRMSDGDKLKLQAIANVRTASGVPAGVSKRTLRRWRVELFRKYWEEADEIPVVEGVESE